MRFRDLIPWQRQGYVRDGPLGAEHPMLELAERMDRLFGDFFGSFSPMQWGHPGQMDAGTRWPELRFRVDVEESDAAVRIAAELPGVAEKDVQVSVADGLLTIRSETHAQDRFEKDGWHRLERSFGSFQRTLRLPPGCELGAASAHFAKGVLTVVIPKLEAPRSAGRRIEIRRGA